MRYTVNGLDVRVRELIESNHEKRADVVSNTGISMTKLSNILTGDAGNLGAESIIALAKHFNVSSDWLLGLSDVRSADTGMREVCEYTGLPEKAVEYIRKAKLDAEYSEDRPKNGNGFVHPALCKILSSDPTALNEIFEKAFEVVLISSNAEHLFDNGDSITLVSHDVFGSLLAISPTRAKSLAATEAGQWFRDLVYNLSQDNNMRVIQDSDIKED